MLTAIDTADRLTRRLGLGDAVVIGAGSMVGAGVFAVWGAAADAAGTGLLIGLVIAGFVAFCNATSSAQLAAVYPDSGGSYVYGRKRLGAGWGHLAGWGFVVGKTASCAAMAMTVGAYLWPSQQRLVAVVAVVGILAVNVGGLARTVAVTRVLLAVALAALLAVVVAGWSNDDASLDRLTPVDASPYDVLRSAAFLFFAFAGYARIATLGEEVRDPAVVIPKAIPRALGGVLVLYAVVAVTALASVPISELAGSNAPLRLVVESGPLHSLAPVTRVGAGLAALGVLLNLIPGISRTVLAMARERDLPATLAGIDERRGLPLRAEFAVAAAVVVVVLVTELRDALALSGVAVLVYYAVTNAAALRLDRTERRWPRALAVAGVIGSLALVAALPPTAILVGGCLLAFGAVVRLATA
ncbi:MAG: APC family permease, partial [Actinomycetota bacterium]|nr:APC family permease [Actinomycetota bacterium]